VQVTDAIKEYVQSKISAALAHYGQEVKEVDVTLSARGGDTGTHGRKCVAAARTPCATLRLLCAGHVLCRAVHFFCAWLL
jgi:ribosome-associated translation inhibitor RaiA